MNKVTIRLFITAIVTVSLTGCADSNLQEESPMTDTIEKVEVMPPGNKEVEEESLPNTVAEVSDKELTVFYEGEDFVKSVFTAGGTMLYVCGIKPNGNFFLGYMQKEEDIFHEFDVDIDEGMRAFNMVIDKQNCCHVLWMSVEKYVLNEQSFDRITYEKSYITIIDSEGKVKKEIDVSDVFSSEQRRPFCFIVDEEGNYYFENDKNLVQILSSGTPGQVTACDGRIEGIGIGKSGDIYCIYQKESGEKELARREESSIFPCDAEIPKADAIYAGIYAGTDSELLLFNKDSGIFAYDGKEVEVRVPGTELPVSGSMINGYGILSDGRLCIMTQEEENTFFYYIPSGK